MSTVTPEWIPMFTAKFSDDEILKPSYAVSVFGGVGICKLCEGRFQPATEKHIRQHIREHGRELARYRRSRDSETERTRLRNLAKARQARAKEDENDEEV